MLENRDLKKASGQHKPWPADWGPLLSLRADEPALLSQIVRGSLGEQSQVLGFFGNSLSLSLGMYCVVELFLLCPIPGFFHLVGDKIRAFKHCFGKSTQCPKEI